MTAKAQLSKKDLTIQIPKLVAMHNLCQNVKLALEPQKKKLFEKSMDGLTFALHWV